MKHNLAKSVSKRIEPFVIAGVLLAVLSLTSQVSAADVTLESPQFSPLGGGSIPVIIGRIIRSVLALSGVIALVMFVYGGLRWMTSGGSSEKIESAKKTLVWSVLGLIVIFASYALVNFVLSALNQF